MTKADDTFEAMTAEFIRRIEDGAAGDWSKPWIDLGEGLPKNASTGVTYKGGNVWLALASADRHGWSGQWWATYKQWEALGAQVRKGEKGTTLIKWGRTECKSHGSDEMCNRCGRMYATAFTVFHAEQVDGWEAPAAESMTLTELERHDRADKWFEQVGARVVEGGDRACYSPGSDTISMPRPEQFRDAPSYYATLAHEHGHWTGAKSRLARDLSGRFGSESYAMEELVAELTAVFVCAELGITATPREDHAAYLANWVQVLRNDVKALWKACSEAQRALGFMVEQVEQVPA